MSQSKPIRTYAIAALIGLGGGLVGSLIGPALPIPHPAFDTAVQKAILAHPDVLPAAVEKLKADDGAKQIAQIGPQALKPFPGAVLGNPDGTRVLVEFMDFACGYCKASEADVARLIAADPQVKVVIRELPILSPESVDAAKMALAAARQGKYAAFHHAMFASGHPGADTIAAAARSAGLDMAAAQKAIADPALQAEVESNLGLARALGITGTPSWIAGGKLLSGALGYDGLVKALGG